MFDWLMEKLNLSDNIDELTEFAKEVKIENLYLVPAFVGLAAPYWDPKARALLIGLTFNHDKRHIARAAFESIAFQTNDVLEEERRMINSDLVIRVDGGMTKNDFLMQILSDYTNCKIERPVNQECTSLGVAYLAGLSHGLWKDLNEIKKLWVVDKTFYPKLDKEARIKTINKWKKAVLKSLSWIE
jgi:glycerol kinase